MKLIPEEQHRIGWVNFTEEGKTKKDLRHANDVHVQQRVDEHRRQQDERLHLKSNELNARAMALLESNEASPHQG